MMRALLRLAPRQYRARRWRWRWRWQWQLGLPAASQCLHSASAGSGDTGGGARAAVAGATVAAVAAAAGAGVALWGQQHTQQSVAHAECAETEKEAECFAQALRAVLREDQLDWAEDELEAHAKPWSSYHSPPHAPRVVVLPESTEDVARVLRICHAFGVSVVPYAGATSLEGQLLCMQAGGVSVDFQRMRAVLAVHEEDMDCEVQAGLGYLDLNKELKDRGTNLFFPLDPGPGACVGGMVATRCSGSTAVRYGTMKEQVLGLVVVLANGEIVRTGTRARKSSAGYDLTRLFVGSEGTLGVVTEATLRLHPRPAHAAAFRVCFATIGEAATAARDAMQSGITVGRCELLDDTMVEIVNKASGGQLPRAHTLLFELTGPSRSAVEEQTTIVRRIAHDNGGHDMAVALDPKECERLWRVRKEALWSTMAAYPDREPLITDVCVPLSKLPEVISESRRELDRSPLPSAIVAHAGDGNFHAVIMFDPSDAEETAEAKRLSDHQVGLALRSGGTCTGEHGVGVGKLKYLERELGAPAVQLMATIKSALDPGHILNPGKVGSLRPGCM